MFIEIVAAPIDVGNVICCNVWHPSNVDAKDVKPDKLVGNTTDANEAQPANVPAKVVAFKFDGNTQFFKLKQFWNAALKLT